MAKTKVVKEEVKIKKETLKCQGKCGRELVETNFYQSKSPFFPTGKVNICKKCLKEMVDIDKIDTVYSVMQILDIPFFYDVWDKVLEKSDPLGQYIRQANSGINQFNGARYKDSIFDSSGSKRANDYENLKDKSLVDDNDRGRLIDRWGYGYTDEELYAFEKKYDLLKNNYPQKTAMHTEALLTYIRYRVKEEMSTAKGDVGEAQKWGGLADKASERAKINPSQLSKADLTGGLNGFGELARAVEKAVDIIEILPKFKEKPQDSVDFTLWCYINYCRRMKNLPDAEYKDIYKFYEDRKEEYKQKDKDREFKFNDEEGELNE